MTENHANCRLSNQNTISLQKKHECSFWMQQLPSHFWVQGEDNAMLYSNRLPPLRLGYTKNRPSCAVKTRCCKHFMGRETTCPCCPRERIATSLKPEKCLCLRGKEPTLVYHFPFINNDYQTKEGTPLVMKLELDVPPDKFIEHNPGENSRPRSLISICASCKNIRDSSGGWQQPENFFGRLYQAEFSHGVCPECASKLYPKHNPKI